MAAVAMSGALVTQILKNAEEPFKQAYLTGNKISREDSIYIYKTYLITEKEDEALRFLKDDWINLHKSNNPNIKVKNEQSKTWHQLDLPTPSNGMFYNYSWTTDPYASDWHQAKSGWPAIDFSDPNIKTNYAELPLKTLTEKDLFLTTVRNIVNKCKTLNQAYQVWPAIVKYVPAEYVQKMHQKRKKRSAEDIGLDEDTLSKINLQHIKHQMSA
jgi:hypothetical protein